MKRGLRRFALRAVLAGALALVAGELLLRAALFSDVAAFERLRRPERYADWFRDDDFWKLQHRFGAPYPAPEHPHPVLGWIGPFSPETYLHHEAARVGARRPVLLFGDSFASCVPSVRCFQSILNSDPEFAGEHYLLNYGVGGYGVDQVLLLERAALDLYEDPFVVLSLMTFDLDRSVLTVRTGQKPRFALADGELVLDSPPIEPDAEVFFAEHPPGIRSYLYRGMLYYRFFPRRLREALRGESAMIERKREINAALITAMIHEVRARGLDFCLVVFHPHQRGNSTLDGKSDWRDAFLRDLIERERIPCIWSKDLVELPKDGAPFDPTRYILPVDGHPTTYFNELVAAEIKRAVLDAR